jgi:hypothetical protein
MSESWQYQIRIVLREGLAALARSDPGHAKLKMLTAILSKRGAALTCQFDAFADYVAEAERNGVETYPLYKWTKATIENPAKKEKYLRSFTIYVDGNAIYSKETADALEQDLQPLIGGDLIEQMNKHDTNPANSPQPPAHLR